MPCNRRGAVLPSLVLHGNEAEEEGLLEADGLVTEEKSQRTGNILLHKKKIYF